MRNIFCHLTVAPAVVPAQYVDLAVQRGGAHAVASIRQVGDGAPRIGERVVDRAALENGAVGPPPRSDGRGPGISEYCSQ